MRNRIRSFSFCIGIGLNQLTPEYFTINVEDNPKVGTVTNTRAGSVSAKAWKSAHSFKGKTKINTRKER